jgi:glycosyltransferase involved in cell wall biosynthesis
VKKKSKVNDLVDINLLRKSIFNIKKELNMLEKTIFSSGLPRVLFIAPHLSTGGMPQYLYKKISLLNEHAEVYCIQYSNTSDLYVIQRDLIKNLLGDRFICLGEDKNQLILLIEEISPDIIHFDDFVESFISEDLILKIYDLSRPYLIYETCHSSNDKPANKKYKPDKFVMVNEWMADRFNKLGVPIDVLEYPIEKTIRPDRKIALSELGLDPEKKHVINVGLFTPGKNQGELIEYARKMRDLPVQFHFIGNTAPNFADYWKPILKDLPDNCKLWGERNDVNKFYQSADLFAFTSLWELNPIVIKESLSHGLPILMRKLESYKDSYDNNSLVHYIKGNIDSTTAEIIHILGLE